MDEADHAPAGRQGFARLVAGRLLGPAHRGIDPPSSPAAITAAYSLTFSSATGSAATCCVSSLVLSASTAASGLAEAALPFKPCFAPLPDCSGHSRILRVNYSLLFILHIYTQTDICAYA